MIYEINGLDAKVRSVVAAAAERKGLLKAERKGLLKAELGGEVGRCDSIVESAGAKTPECDWASFRRYLDWLNEYR